MSSRIVQKKTFLLSIGEKTYRYTETIEELHIKSTSEVIDLTSVDSDISQRALAGTSKTSTSGAENTQHADISKPFDSSCDQVVSTSVSSPSYESDSEDENLDDFEFSSPQYHSSSPQSLSPAYEPDDVSMDDWTPPQSTTSFNPTSPAYELPDSPLRSPASTFAPENVQEH